MSTRYTVKFWAIWRRRRYARAMQRVAGALFIGATAYLWLTRRLGAVERS